MQTPSSMSPHATCDSNITVPSRTQFGHLFADAVTFPEAIGKIIARAKAGVGGYVVTPNVDHVCLAEHHPELVQAYEHAFLALVDGAPLYWFSHVAGRPLPAKISGSDLVLPLLEQAAQHRLRVFFLGARPGVGALAARRIQRRLPQLKMVGTYAPPLGFDHRPAELREALEQVRAANPSLVFVALGCPKQELFMMRHWQTLSPAVCIGVGASLDFLAGQATRAPRWVSQLGLEWLFRLIQEPRRLCHRYLVRDREILRILWRSYRQARQP